jgi:outer membrane receptor protein involved in Fe transport
VGDSITQVSLDEVVVTSKETFSHKDMPASVSRLSGRQLEQEGIHSLKSISAYIPNFYIPDYGSKLYAPIYIRGIGTRTGSPSAGLYVDDVPYFETTAFDFDFFDIEHIEVLRGPQATLYGRNTMAGIINVTTKSPLQHQGTNIRLSGGNYGDAKAALTHYAHIGKRLGVAAGVNYDRRGGYFTNQQTDKQADTRNDVAGRLRLTFQHSEKAQSDLHVNFEHSRQDGYPYRVYHTDTDKMDSVNYDDPSSYTRNLLSAGYRFAYNTAWGSIRAITGYQNISDKQAVDQDFTAKPLVFATQKQQQQMLSQEVIAQSNLENNYRWVTGVFGFMQQADKSVDAFLKIANMHQYVDYDQPTYGLAAYHQSTYQNLFVDGLSATLGGRLDYENVRQKYASAMDPPMLPPTNTDFTLSFFEFLPKLSLRYSVAQQSVYASVSKGYKTGGFNTSFNTEEEQTYQPETNWNYELGVKLNLPGNTSVEAAAFYIDWTNQQITQMIILQSGSSGSLTRNAGRSESKGVELSVTTQPLKNLNLNVNYGYTDARFKRYPVNDAAATDYAGNYIPMVPQQSFSAGVAYRWPVAKRWTDDITFHAQFNGTGKIYWLEDNVAAQRAYGLLNADVNFAKGPVSLSLWARNMLNKRYQVYYFEINNRQIGVNNSYVQQGKPLTFGVDVEIKF